MGLLAVTNSRAKGARGEREAAALLRAHGFQARRGQQFAGGTDSPDVVTDLPFHVEVKRVEALRLYAACKQAERDADGKPWVVLHRRNGERWVAVLDAEAFLGLVKP